MIRYIDEDQPMPVGVWIISYTPPGVARHKGFYTVKVPK